MSTFPLFVYGSLMSAKVMQRVIGRTPTHQQATLYGFHRYKIYDELYPAIARKEGGQVRGMYVKDLTSAELATMDAWEDDEYERVEVETEVEQSPNEMNGAHFVKAYTYLWSPQSDHRRLHGAWEFEVDFSPVEQQFVDHNCP